MSDFPEPLYKVGDRVYCHKISETVLIIDIQITTHRQLRYQYKTDTDACGVVPECDLGDPPISLEDVPDTVYINSCSITDLLNSFPNLPGGKGVLARKIIKARNETPFDDEASFINRMLEIDPKVEWEQISYKLRYDKESQIGA